jgi:hypothetical protein
MYEFIECMNSSSEEGNVLERWKQESVSRLQQSSDKISFHKKGKGKDLSFDLS